MNNSPLFFVIYDGINNSVFAGQVLQPLLNKLKTGQYKHIFLVSFEKTGLHKKDITRHTPSTAGLETIILKRWPFLGTISLYYAAYQLKRILKKINRYHIIARGPLAGWICMYALNNRSCTIQARGLLAAEYEYSHRQNNNLFTKIWHYWRLSQLKTVEKTVYYPYQKINNLSHATIEAVSPALKHYLIQTFKTHSSRITIASDDIPSIIPPAQRLSWRIAIRTQLGITPDTYVYCYNGSIKPWQYPQSVITFFKEKLQNYPEKPKNVFFLVLTQDKAAFELLMQKNNIDSSLYIVHTVEHNNIYLYLAACDAGIIFRESHIINWVARPTKVLEYRAVGLEIIHNNTIDYLNNM